MSYSQSFVGKFIGSPFRYGLSRANTMVLPMDHIEDYESFSRMQKPSSQPPVLCSFQEKYQLLEQVILAAFVTLHPLNRCVMTAMMPGGVRLPARLLRDDVFLVHDSEDEFKRLHQQGYAVLVIKECIIRHALEAGDNTLILSWYPAEESPHCHGWTEFINILSNLNIVPLNRI